MGREKLNLFGGVVTLKEAVKQYENDIRKNWHNNINWETKSRFEGICIGDGENEIMITPEMLSSNDWAIAIRPTDKEHIKELNNLFDELQK